MATADYRADTTKPIRNGDAVFGNGNKIFQVYERPEVVPLASASCLAVFESMSERFDEAPSGWNALGV